MVEKFSMVFLLRERKLSCWCCKENLKLLEWKWGQVLITLFSKPMQIRFRRSLSIFSSGSKIIRRRSFHSFICSAVLEGLAPFSRLFTQNEKIELWKRGEVVREQKVRRKIFLQLKKVGKCWCGIIRIETDAPIEIWVETQSNFGTF